MKSFTALLLFITAITYSASAQGDTTIHYYWGDYKECRKDSAVYISKVYATADKWQQNTYFAKGMKLKSEELWLDAKCTRPFGTSTWYNEQGVVIKKQTYKNEKTAETRHFFDNGNKKALLSYNLMGALVRQTGWEENGTEIPDYIYEKEAFFPGGPEAWVAYLTSKINPNTAAKAKAPLGVYTVKVQFIVNKEGKTERVEAVSIPAACPKCGPEAVKIIQGSPRWEHAIQYGHPVIYQAIQYVSWQVVD